MLSAVLIGAWSIGVSAQDLGSSNKLFGNGKKTASKTAKREPAVSITKAVSKTKKVKPAPTRVIKRASPATVLAKVPVRIAPRKPGKSTELNTFKTYEPFNRETNEKYARLIAEGNAARRASDNLAGEMSFKRATALKPNDPAAFVLLGGVYYDTMRWEQAEKVLRLALSLDPGNAAVCLSLSRVLSQPVAAENPSERYDEAEQFARRAVDLQIAAAAPQDQLGASLERQGLLGAETEAAYRRAISADPSFAPAYAHLGRLLRRKGKNDAASVEYAAAIIRANDTASLILVSASLQSEQRYADSIPLLRKALAAEPRNYTTLVMLGRAMIAEGDLRSAESNLIFATRVSPLSYAGFGELGKLYIRQAKSEMAETVLLHGSRLADAFERRDLAEQFETLGDTYAKSGRLASAENAYQSAMSMDPTRGTLAAKIAGIRR